MKQFFSAFLILFLQHSFSQKVVKKSIVSPSVSLISIDASNCFEIHLDTRNTDEMSISAKIEGEYQNDLQLNLIKNGSTIEVDAGFKPDFMNPNDKLSAHKVVSISLHLILPKNSNAQIYGDDCNIIIKGVYDKLNVTLNNGFCKVNASAKKAIIETHSGNITLNTNKAKVEAKSKFGWVKGDSLSDGNNVYILSTIMGNIQLNRIE